MSEILASNSFSSSSQSIVKPSSHWVTSTFYLQILSIFLTLGTAVCEVVCHYDNLVNIQQEPHCGDMIFWLLQFDHFWITSRYYFYAMLLYRLRLSVQHINLTSCDCISNYFKPRAVNLKFNDVGSKAVLNFK